MKLGLKWTLPGDIGGGLLIFGIMFSIAIIELYILKGYQGLLVNKMIGGGSSTTASPGDLVLSSKPCGDLTGKKRKKCLEAKAQGSGGGGMTSQEQKRILTQAKQ